MGRSTQWIGLTARGQAFVVGLKSLPSDKRADGMFETIPLGKWEAPASLGEKAKIVREVVQASPWSSGPMIFTMLVIEYHQSGGDVFTEDCFQWIQDPTVTAEFDQKNGSFWV